MNNTVTRTGKSRYAVRSLTCFVSAVAIGAFGFGCTHQPMKSEPIERQAVSSPWAAPTSTAQWNEYASELIARNQVGQFPALRILAYTNLAINNAIVAATAQGLRPEGAAAGAAAATLTYLMPKEERAIATRLSGETEALGATHRTDFMAGVEVGRSAAADVIAFAKADNAGAKWAGTVPADAASWTSLATPPAPPLGPQLGATRPFFLATASEFRSPPPPAIGSPEFAATLAEVRKVSDARSYEQVRFSQYWENLTGAFTAGVWNELARGAIASHGLGEAESARVLALMHMAGFDAILACHDSKFVYWVPRPKQLDPGIKLAVGAPNHPSYPSNHSCISGAMGLVLDAKFPDQRGRYVSMARQAGESRIYAGIHYRIDIDEGMNIAQKVVDRALDTGIPAGRPFMPQGL